MKLRTVSVERIGVVAGLLVAVAAGVSVLSGAAQAPSVLVGGAFMLLNYRLIITLVSRLIAPGGGAYSALGVLVLKLALMGVLLAGVLYQVPVEPMSFALGASMLPVAAVLDAAVLGTPVPPWEDDEPGPDATA